MPALWNAPASVYCHPPGAPSRWGVVDVGLKCTHSCKFCYYSYLDGSDDQFSGMRHAKFHSEGFLLKEIRALKRNGFIGFDVTGGEPTIHPSIVEIIREATELGLASRIITLGQFLGTKDLLPRLLGAGVTDFLFSFHAANDALFRHLTGSSLQRLLVSMDALDDREFAFCTNTTVVEDNFRTLPEIADEITHHRIYASNFILMNAYYAWGDGRANGIQARYDEVRPYLTEARDILEAAGVAVNIRYAPMCSVRGMERNLVGITGVRYDPHEWMNQVDHYADDTADPDVVGSRIDIRPGQAPGAELFMINAKLGDIPIIAGRGDPRAPSKVFPESCAGCAAMQVCDGIDANYLSRNGVEEFQRYDGVSRGTLIDRDRLSYARAFAVKVA